MFLTKDTHCLIQGITGKEGQRALAWMRASGVTVAAGVTPGKGGQVVEGVPVYNTVAEATAHHRLELTSIYVPPRFVMSAALEAIEAAIPVVHILGEGVPTSDSAKILAAAQIKKTRVIGPSSIGFVLPNVGAVGSIGGGDISQFQAPSSEKKGIAVLSKSGGMATTIANMLGYAAIPQSFVIGIGGDRFIGTTFADLLPDLAADSSTAGVVIIGEIGGAYEEILAEQITALSFPKPIIAFISGMFAETLPQGISFGHAGAIVSKTEGTRNGKISTLQQAGALIAQQPSDIVTLINQFVYK